MELSELSFKHVRILHTEVQVLGRLFNQGMFAFIYHFIYEYFPRASLSTG